jgi:hypothetical protein
VSELPDYLQHTDTNGGEVDAHKVSVQMLSRRFPPAVHSGAMAQRIRREYLPGILLCHAKLLRREPQASGKVIVRLSIAAGGRVSTVHVVGFHPDIESCITRRAKSWSFPEADSDGELELPFMLSTG